MEELLEDGEIVDDEDIDHATLSQPTTSGELRSNDNESDIDRIIEETKATRGMVPPTNIITLNNTEILSTSTEPSEDPEIRALRLAVLGTVGKPRQDKEEKSTEDAARKRKRENEIDFANKNAKSTRYKSSRTTSTSRDRERVDSRKEREKDRHREIERGRDRDRDRRVKTYLSERGSKTCGLTVEVFSGLRNDHRDDSRHARHRVSPDLVLGEESNPALLRKTIDNLNSSTDLNIEDNYESVGMDIESNGSEPDTNGKKGDEENQSTNPSCVTNEGDSESVNRSKTTSENSDSGIVPDYDADTYKTKYELLQDVDQQIQKNVLNIEQAHKRKRDLMKELEGITKSLTQYKMNYVEACKKRDNLRREIQEYEEFRMNKLLNENTMEDDQVDDLDGTHSDKKSTLEEIVQPLVIPIIKPDQDSITGSAGKDDEERLREALLQKFKSVKNNHTNTTELSKLKKVITEKNGVVPGNSVSPFGSNESADEENSNNSSFASLHSGDRGNRSSDLISYSNSSLPIRFLHHLDSTTRNPTAESCPFELMGKCKDYTCSYTHFNDHNLDDRDLLLMVIQFAPDISGHHYNNNYRKKIDVLLERKKQSESGYQYFLRLLNGLGRSSMR